MERTITFSEPWGKNSWKVNYDGPYDNNRLPHVEVGETNMNRYNAGEIYKLVNLRSTGRAIMWDVVGVDNSREKGGAHFTVYFGPDAKVKVNDFK